MIPSLYIGIAVVVAAGIAGMKVYSMGKEACQREYEKAVAEQKDKDTQSVVTLAKADVKREVRYVEKIVKVREANDACLDQRMPDGIVDALGGVQLGHDRTPKP